MEERFLREGHPRDLRLVNVAGLGGDGRRRGINHFAHRGMLSRLLCSNLSLANAIYPHISAGDFALFMAPQGVMSHMMRAIAGKKPGVLTSVGLRTFVDPRRDGCRMNQKAWESGEEVVQLVELAGQEQLFFPAFPLDVCIIKGSTADAWWITSWWGGRKTPGSSLSPRSAGWRPLPGGCASRWRGCRRCRRTSKR